MNNHSRAPVHLLGIFFFSFLGLWVLPMELKAQIFEKKLDVFADSPLILKAGSGTKAISVADMNQDGTLDFYVVVKEEGRMNDASSWNRLYVQEDGVFIDKTPMQNASTKGAITTRNSIYNHKIGASWGDYNNDRYPDLFLANSGKDILLKNNGDGSFTDVTDRSGVGGFSDKITAQGVWFDMDHDGDLDLYAATHMDLNADRDDRSNRLYENLGGDRFRNVADSLGVNDPGYTWSILPFDVNHDGWLDIYLANDFGANRLYVRTIQGGYEDQTSTYGLEDFANGMGLGLADLNQDTKYDLFLTNITEMDEDPANQNRLFSLDSSEVFVHREQETKTSLAGWGWGVQIADFDLDSDMDIHVSNGYRLEAGQQINRLFSNQLSETGRWYFTRVEQAWGIQESTESYMSAAADFDEDGDIDLLTSNNYQAPIYFENVGAEGNFLKVWLHGVSSNSFGVGSKVTLFSDRTEWVQWYHGTSMLSQHIIPIHFGLGQNKAIDSLKIEWPGGQIDRVHHLPINSTITIQEGVGIREIVSIEEQDHNQLSDRPKEFMIQNYPNPFNPNTHIRYQLPSSGQVSIQVYTILGTLVWQEQAYRTQGHHSLRWEAGHLSSGLYFVRIGLNGQWLGTHRMILTK